MGKVTDRGRLTVFLGAVDGVGKTARMNAAAGRARAERRDVASSMMGPLNVPELTRRRPDLVLAGSLAASNPEGSLHPRRWQDVEELLEAGIDVFATANVVDIESLKDVVAQVTGVKMESPVPDSLLQSADAIELVDCVPTDILKWWRQGQDRPDGSHTGPSSVFYREGPLIALRGLAVRYVADRVDRDLSHFRRVHDVDRIWPVRERLLVGIGSSPTSAEVVRAAKRIADRLRVDWVAVFVETPEYAEWSRADREQVWETLRLARALGAETATISGSGPGALLEYARTHNLTRVVVGKPGRPRWWPHRWRSHVDDLIYQDDLDVYVVATDESATGGPSRPRRRSRTREYLLTAAAVAGMTALAVALRGHLALANLIMLYLVTVVGVAAGFGRGPGILASVLSVAAFDWFCVPPFGTFNVHDAQYFLVFAVMLVVAVFISALTARLRRQAALAQRREERMRSLSGISSDLLPLEDPRAITRVAAEDFSETFGCRVRIVAPDPFGSLQVQGGGGGGEPVDPEAAAWAFEHGRPAGRATDSLPNADGLYLPLRVGSDSALGLVEFPRGAEEAFEDPERLELAETMAGQTAAALERAQLAAESRRAQHLAELNRLKSQFVAVAAHELRTPLTSLGMSVELIAERLPAAQGPDDSRLQPLLAAAVEDVERLRAVVDDLLDLSRLEQGTVALEPEALDPAELVEGAIRSAVGGAADDACDVRSEVPENLPPVYADPAQLERALRNLVENGMRYAGPGGQVVVGADQLERQVQFSVADNGPGLSLADQDRVFEPFVAGEQGGSAGLGLAIVRGIIRAHGGEIWVDSGPGPGAVFTFTVPRADRRPAPEEANESGIQATVFTTDGGT